MHLQRNFFVLIFLGSQYPRMKQKLVSTTWCCLSWCLSCMCQAGEVSDTDPYFHIQLSKVHTVKPHVQAKCLHFESKPPCFWFCVCNSQKYRIELNWPMTNDHDKAKSSSYTTYKHDSPLQGITHHGQIECCFMQNCGVYLLITKKKSSESPSYWKLGGKLLLRLVTWWLLCLVHQEINGK